jgi:hypothetical protein
VFHRQGQPVSKAVVTIKSKNRSTPEIQIPDVVRCLLFLVPPFLIRAFNQEQLTMILTAIYATIPYKQVARMESVVVQL